METTDKKQGGEIGMSIRETALIISYSYSGNTHRIAKTIQSLTGADWSEIYPWQPYPVEFPELLEQVQREVRNGYKPRLLPGAYPPQLYSVIFAGSPNWCGTIAPPLASWLSKHDLSGKIILPFYSHCGGVAGDLAGDIAALCPKADVREALGIVGSGEEDLPVILANWMRQAKNDFRRQADPKISYRIAAEDFQGKTVQAENSRASANLTDGI